MRNFHLFTAEKKIKQPENNQTFSHKTGILFQLAQRLLNFTSNYQKTMHNVWTPVERKKKMQKTELSDIKK